MTQVGGDHYEKMSLQPWEVIRLAELDFWEGNIIKYLMRYRKKNGLEDLKKARHYLDYLIERESTGLDRPGDHRGLHSSTSVDTAIAGLTYNKE